MKFTLSEDQVRDLVELLGAAQGAFEETAKEMPGVPSGYFLAKAKECEGFIATFAEEFNRQLEG